MRFARQATRNTLSREAAVLPLFALSISITHVNV
jgi:hypothetical protein